MAGHKHKLSAAGLLVTLGIIYGDIGTSPLYVLKAIVDDREITELLVYGGVSCIFWTLTIQTTLKYIIITLRADNKGEGGIFSLYALVRRRSKWLFWPAMIGAGTMLCDGMITPAISVSSAVEGILVLNDSIPVMPIVIGILTALFIIQRYGTKIVGAAFGPIMLVWFSLLAILGLRGVISHPEVLHALNPKYAIDLLSQYPGGFWLLGAVFLCTTGADALYGDLGHCGKTNIRVSWTFVKVALLLNYMGQAGWVMGQTHLEGRNPFYALMPDWFLLPGIIIATMAAIIASQAMISGAFTLVGEAVNLNFWPRVQIKYPTELKGQLYIPSVNWMIWAGCMGVILYFQESENMESAYGFFITITMLMTTILLAFYLRSRLHWHPLVVGALLSLFITMELGFFIANVIKLKEAWVMIIVYVAVLHIMWITYMYRRLSNSFLKFVNLDDYVDKLHTLSADESVPRYASHLVFMTKANYKHQIEDKIVESILAKVPKRADVYWFVHIERTNEPYTKEYEMEELVNDLIIKVTIHLGFRIQPRVNNLFRFIVDDMVRRGEFDMAAKPTPYKEYHENPDFKFVLLEKYLSADNDLNLKETVITEGYNWMKKNSISDIDAWGLEEADTELELVPLVVNPSPNVQLVRKD
ncbi:MAG: hypothetical protein RL220_27 [Bacteroidota bacterium]|jgi:KUP system potassium uptake protein